MPVGVAGALPHQKFGPFNMTQLKYKISQKGRVQLEDSSSPALILILATHILATLQMLFYRLQQAEAHTHLIFSVVQEATGKAGSYCPLKEKIGFQMTQECPRDHFYLFMYLLRLASMNHY